MNRLDSVNDSSSIQIWTLALFNFFGRFEKTMQDINLFINFTI